MFLSFILIVAYIHIPFFFLKIINLYPFYPLLPSCSPLPFFASSGNHQSVLCIYELFFFFLDFTYNKDHTIFVFDSFHLA